ncbi:MAG: helix-turn-helix domain-containing protein [Clostridiales bacterium]|nr:helix-turn-helix domain-containing protein [Clostridiales bacterium]
MPFHWHDSYELVYVLTGTAIFRYMDRPSRVCPSGYIMCTEPYVIHDTSVTSGTSFLLIMVPLAFMKKYIPDVAGLHFEIPVYDENDLSSKSRTDTMKNLLQKMIETEENRVDGGILRFTSQIFELMFQLYHNFSATVAERTATKKDRDYERLQTLVAYVHKTYMNPISLKEVSQTLHLQPQYFCHYFKKYFGQSYSNYVYEIRLVNIETDLIQTDEPIAVIAEKHGFVSPDQFRRKFYEKNGCTPREFRSIHSINRRKKPHSSSLQSPASPALIFK